MEEYVSFSNFSIDVIPSYYGQNYIVCGGFFPFKSSTEELNVAYENFKNIVSLKKSQTNVKVILSARDIGIFSGIFLFLKSIKEKKSMKNSLLKISKFGLDSFFPIIHGREDSVHILCEVFSRKRRDILYLLQNSLLFLEINEYIFCTNSDISVPISTYLDWIDKLENDSLISPDFKLFLTSYRTKKFESGKTFIIGDSKSFCDSPCISENDENKYVYLNCEIGKELGKVYYSISSKIIESVNDIECFGFLKLKDSKMEIVGVNAKGMEYDFELSYQTYPSEEFIFHDCNEEITAIGYYHLVYTFKNISCWRIECKDDKLLILLSKIGKDPKKPKCSVIIDDISESSEKGLKSPISPDDSEQFAVNISGHANFTLPVLTQSDNNSDYCDENSTNSLQSFNTEKIHSVLRSLDLIPKNS